MRKNLRIKKFCKRSLAAALALTMVMPGTFVSANAEENGSVNLSLIAGETYYVAGGANMAITEEPNGKVATAEVSKKLVVDAPMYNHVSNTGSSLNSFAAEANEAIELSQAEFTFRASGENWIIYNEYANLFWSNTGATTFFSGTETEAKVVPSTEVENAFYISKSNDQRYIIFYNNNMDFNSNTNFTANYGSGSYSMILLEKQNTVSEEDVIPGYKQVTKIVDGNKYLIAYRWPADETNVFVLYPTNGTDNQTKLVKTNDDIKVGYSELVIQAKARGTTTVVVDGITYNISVSSDPADASRDIDVNAFTVTTGSENPATSGNTEGPLSYAFDNNEGTWWHNDYTNVKWWEIQDANMEDYLWVEMTFHEATVVDGLRYLPRGIGNGNITGYRIEGKGENGEWTTLSTGEWAISGWQNAEFDATKVTAVRLVATATQGTAGNNKYSNAKEIRLTLAADKTNLADIVEMLNGKDYSNYTPSSLAPFEAALVEAEGMLQDDTVDQSQVDQMCLTLNELFNSLVAKADTERLQQAINAYTGLNLSYYTPATVEAFHVAYEAATATCANEDATQQEVNTALTNLLNAYNNLKTKANKIPLQGYYDAYSSADLSRYTEDSVAMFQEALTFASAVLEDENATEEDVANAIVEMTNAYEALVVKVDKSELQMVISAYEGIDLSKYTPASAEVFRAAIETAQAVLVKEDATQEEVSEATINLVEAYSKLTAKGNKTALENEYLMYSWVDLSGYTEASVALFQEAMVFANEVLEDENATQADINNARVVLDNAYYALVKKVNKSSLQSVVEEKEAQMEGLEDGYYTAGTIAALEEALAAAKTVLADEKATQNEVDDAKTALNQAWVNLCPQELVDRTRSTLDNYYRIVKMYDETYHAGASYEDAMAIAEDAEQLLANERVSANELNKVLNRIVNKFERYIKDASMRKNLEVVYNTYSELDLSIYTEESAAALLEAIEHAREVLADVNATYDEMNNAQKAILDAKGALEELPVEKVLTIITQPVSTAVLTGLDAVVSVEADGDGLTYAWYYKNPGNKKFYASGASFGNENVYSIPMAAWRDGQEVYCVITDAYGNSVQTDTVTVSIKKAAAEITLQPQDVVVAAKNDMAVVTVDAVGEDLTYTWYYKNPGNVKFYVSGDEFVSEDGKVYSIPVASWRDGQEVYCVITDASGAVLQTNTVTLSIAK